ncbi:MAG: efflux RND transporter periplasmic adaptor subunit [Phycisphaerae bacterium]
MAKAKKSKKWPWFLVLLILVVGGALWWIKTHHATAAVETHIHTAVVKKGTLTVHVYATGSVQANRTVDVKCQAGGEIETLPYRIGNLVKRGQVILTVDPTLEIQALNIAQQDYKQAKYTWESAQLSYEIAKENLVTARETDMANILSARAQLKNDTLNVQRDKTLLKEGLASQQQYDTDYTAAVKDQQALNLAQIARSSLKQQALQVKLQKLNVQLDKVAMAKAEFGVSQAQTNLQYCTVKAPFTGYVANVDVQRGQIIASATNNVGGGTTIMTLVDLSHIYINATIDEGDINRVKPGDKVQITAAGAPGIIFPGKVVLIGPESVQDQTSSNTSSSTSESNIVTFQAQIEVLGPERMLLKPGMTANLDIFTNRLPDVVYIPLQAVVITNGRDTVTVVKPDGSTKEVDVTLGVRNDTNWQVLSGVNVGQKVVVHLGNAMSMWTPHR